MVSEAILNRLAAEFDNDPKQIRAVVDLLGEGAPPSFIRRYRRDETGDLGEERIIAIEERWHFLTDLQARKDAIRQQATERGNLDPDFDQMLEECFDQDQLDDIFQTFRTRRRTAGLQAEDKGLMPLALALRHGTVAEPTLLEAVQAYVAPDKDLPTPESVIEGVGAILAESFANDPRLRARVREELSRGILRATAAAPSRKDAQRYKEFFDFAEPVRKIPAGRMLALRRAEREGIVTLQLTLPEGRELEIFRDRFAPDVDRESERGRFLDEVFKIAYSQLVRPACEADIRRRIKEKADRETIRSFLRGLRAHLLAPGLGPKKALGVRASRQTVWLALVGEDGSLQQHKTLNVRLEPRPEAQARGEAKGPAVATDAPATEGPTTSAEGAGAGTDSGPGPESPQGQQTQAAGDAQPAPTAPSEVVPAEVVPAEVAPAETAGDAAGEPGGQAASGGAPGGTELDSASGAEPAPEQASEAAHEAAADGAHGSESAHGPESEHESESEAARAGNPAISRAEAVQLLADLIAAEMPAGIAIPHGRRLECSSELVRDALALCPGLHPVVLPIDETTAAISATGPHARRELPGVDAAIRTTTSLVRRLQDPLLELLNTDPKALALGHTLAEVHQAMLGKSLEQGLAACVAHVGLDLNRATVDQLARVPGLSSELGQRIVDSRAQRGGFARLRDLDQVPSLDAAAFRHIAGSLRVLGGLEPLDTTGIHPENYELVARIAADQNVLPKDLLGRSQRHVDPAKYATDACGRLRVLDVLYELSTAGSDPRGIIVPFHNDGVRTLADLKPDLELKGRIASLTDFGAFVDLGVGQDGLVHISQIFPSRLRDPDNQLRVGEVITVWVNRVDPATRKISLTMFRPRHLLEQRQAQAGDRMSRAGGGGHGGGGPRRNVPDQKRMSRAARAPERSRDHRRGEEAGAGAGDGGKGGGRGYSRGRRDEFSGPREITVESKKRVPESVGFKGELRSLSSLRSLLTGKRPAASTAPVDGAESAEEAPRSE